MLTRLQLIFWNWRGWEPLANPDIRLFGFLLVQLLILRVPPIWLALNQPTTKLFDTALEQLVFTVLGVSGMAALIVPGALLAVLFGETISSVLMLLAYVALAILVFLHYYVPTWKRVFLVSIINGYLTVWSILFGIFLVAVGHLD
jgi:hypothetical protein